MRFKYEGQWYSYNDKYYKKIMMPLVREVSELKVGDNHYNVRQKLKKLSKKAIPYLVYLIYNNSESIGMVAYPDPIPKIYIERYNTYKYALDFILDQDTVHADLFAQEPLND
jgi:hypothetical protein